MRYLPLTDADRSAMLDLIGAKSIDELFADVPREHGFIVVGAAGVGGQAVGRIIRRRFGHGPRDSGATRKIQWWAATSRLLTTPCRGVPGLRANR